MLNLTKSYLTKLLFNRALTCRHAAVISVNTETLFYAPRMFVDGWSPNGNKSILFHYGFRPFTPKTGSYSVIVCWTSGTIVMVFLFAYLFSIRHGGCLKNNKTVPQNVEALPSKLAYSYTWERLNHYHHYLMK